MLIVPRCPSWANIYLDVEHLSGLERMWKLPGYNDDDEFLDDWVQNNDWGIKYAGKGACETLRVG
jgi:hypothetical protein